MREEYVLQLHKGRQFKCTKGWGGRCHSGKGVGMKRLEFNSYRLCLFIVKYLQNKGDRALSKGLLSFKSATHLRKSFGKDVQLIPSRSLI